LKLAFGNTGNAIIDFLLEQDFHIRNGDVIFFNWEAWSLERAVQLLAAHPQRVAELTPSPQSMQFCRNAQSVRLMISLAVHCSPDAFRPSDCLASVVRNRNLDDADMVGAIRQLCELGARVRENSYAGLDQFHPCPNYPESRQALQEHEAWQDEVKEPDCD
jgi:hypothetical protein